MKNWIEKNNWWLHWTIKLLYPIAIFLGLAVGNYLIASFGIETKAHATDTYIQKIGQEEFNNKTVSALERLNKLNTLMNKRQIVDREQIVVLNQKHNIPTKDYPIE